MANVSPFPSREAIQRNKRDRLENGYTFPLTVTSLGLGTVLEARVRRITTLDRATLEGLPKPLQDTVFEGLHEFQKAREQAEGMTDPEDMAGMLANNEKIVKTADAFCKAAFIYPRLYDTEAEIARHDDPNTPAYLVDDIDVEDRVSVFMACLDSESAAFKRLKVFRPNWGAGLRHDPPQPIAEATQRDLEPQPAGL